MVYEPRHGYCGACGGHGVLKLTADGRQICSHCASVPETVNHPVHYNKHPSGVECIDIVEEFSFSVGCAIKYLWRYSYKGGLEDLQKALWYVQREIERLGRREEEVHEV